MKNEGCHEGVIEQIYGLFDQLLLKENPTPTDQDIDDSITNICRCGSYPRIRKAIHKVAKQNAEA